MAQNVTEAEQLRLAYLRQRARACAAEHRVALLELDAYARQIHETYGLVAGDQVDLDTGALVRAVQPDNPPPKPPA